MSRKIMMLAILATMMILLNGMGMKEMAEASTNQAKSGLIVVDPGFSQFALKVAQKISEKLTQKGYTVKLVKANKFNPQETAKRDLLVLGGPTYVGQPSGGLKKVVESISQGTKLKTLLFVTGGADCSGLEPLKKLATEKGLSVVGSAGILDTKAEAPNMEAKINKLLETI
jgi:flavodoxin